MKEATGELNMTVITIVAIAALVAFFYLVIWPTIQVNMTLSSACTSAGGAAVTQNFDDGSRTVCTANTSTVQGETNAQCTYTDADGDRTTKRCG